MCKRFQSVITMTLVFLVIMVVAGCGYSAEVYKIGGIFPMTGSVAASGVYLRDGAQLAIDKYNAAGGINGHKLELVVEDSKGVPRDGIMAYKKLVDVDEVIAVLPTLSSVVMALVPEINAGEVVMINTLAKTNDLVGAGPRIFSITVPTSRDGVAQARFAFEKLGARTAVMLYLKADTGVSYDKFICGEFERLGGKILSRDGHDAATADYRAVLTKIKQLNPDVIFIESLYQETASIVKQARELGITAQTVSYSTVLSGQFREIAGEAANGHIISVSGFDPEDPMESVQEFVKTYKAKYNETPIIDAAMAYDAVCMIAEAIKIGGYSADGIANGLMQFPGFEGATGIIPKFDKDHIVDRPISIQYFKDGEWLLYDE
ncbi:ethanolamine utilization protein EutJ [Synergistales bacterium]|nr:ethanolamine utilization protein EutJ [Synergistales bacterium]